MRTRTLARSGRLALTAIAAAALIAAPAPAAAAPTQHLVTMGAVDPAVAPNPNPPEGPGRTDRFEYLAYYPERLEVHRGDTIYFRRDGFHTVSFAPDLATAPRWLRRDELKGTSAAEGGRATHPSCTTGPTAPPCVISDPGMVFSSGAGPARVTIDLPEGSYAYYCQIHAAMTGTVAVVPDHEPIASPGEVETARRAQVQADTANGEAVLAAGQTPKVEPVGDRLRWTVKVGDVTADGRVAVLRFLPTNLRIGPGDDVVFTVPDRSSEIHTASFPADAFPLGFLTYLNPACDPDQIDSGLPGVAFSYQALLLGCPAGSTFEMQFHEWAWKQPLTAPGGIISTAATVHDTGIMTPADVPCHSACDPWTGQRFPSSAQTTFPVPGTFSYICNVHNPWGMDGAVVVGG